MLTKDMIGSYVYYKTERAGWQFAKVTQVVEDDDPDQVSHTIKLLDLGRHINVKLKELGHQRFSFKVEA